MPPWPTHIKSDQERQPVSHCKVRRKLVPQATTRGETGDSGIACSLPQLLIVAADFFHQFAGHNAVFMTIQFDMTTQVVAKLLCGFVLWPDFIEDVFKGIGKQCFTAKCQR